MRNKGGNYYITRIIYQNAAKYRSTDGDTIIFSAFPFAKQYNSIKYNHGIILHSTFSGVGETSHLP